MKHFSAFEERMKVVPLDRILAGKRPSRNENDRAPVCQWKRTVRLGDGSTVLRTCSNTTHRHKPFCLEHVTYNPYASKVISKLAYREKLDSLALRGEGKWWCHNTKRHHPRMEEILAYIRQHGNATVKRIGMLLWPDLSDLSDKSEEKEKIRDFYVKSLHREKLITIRKSKRNAGNFGTAHVLLRKSAK